MLRILHMIGSLEMGGAQTMVMALYRAMDRSKIQFDFVIDCDVQSGFVDEIQELGGRIFRLPKFNGVNYGQVRAAWRRFFREHPEYRILHSHIRSYASVFLPVAKACGVRTIIHSHNTSNGKGLMSAAKKILQYPLRFQADYFFGCSEIAGKWLFGDRIVKGDRYVTLKNAVDLERFAYREEARQRIRRELGADDETLVIGHVGRMNPQKNHIFLLACIRALADRQEKVMLLLLGDGELREEISRYVTALGLEDRVLMLGVRRNVEAYFSAMDCVALPSLHEGLPVVIVEAQANGLPCFVSDTVTREVQLSRLVTYLPITQGPESWADAVLACEKKHEDVSEQIRNSGFCVESSAKWLCDFYSAVAEGATAGGNRG